MAQIDELLRVLTVESNLVRRLTQVRRTGHAGVAIGHIKSTRVTCIPVGIPLYHVGVRLLLYLGWYSGSTRIPSKESSLWTTRETACGICTWRTVVGNLPKGYIRNVPLPRVPREQSTRQSQVLPDTIPHYSEDTYMIPMYKGTCRIGERIAKADSPPWQPIATNT
jgi:hypothetical protein